MQKTVVINIVGLAGRDIGAYTPFLKAFADKGRAVPIRSMLPAVTTSVQSTYLTGKWPSEHGIVGNGWYFRDECEIKFWRQSNRLVEAPKVWDLAREKDPSFTVSNMFWWYAMYSTADWTVTPRPMYPADGRKFPDCYTFPMDLRPRLQKELGTFPLFKFWGPRTAIDSSRWIAEASMKVDQWNDPTLTLIYLPHLDYHNQSKGPGDPKVASDLQEIDTVVKDLVTYYEKKNARVILLSEYGINPVSRPVHLNRLFRKQGWISIREELGLELMDAGTSKVFAVADHQVAHIYVQEPGLLEEVRKLVQAMPGVEQVLGAEEKVAAHLDHDRAGELVAIADADAWFTYYYWLDDKKAPDFARTVDIHRKPGYDPVELFTNPKIKPLVPYVVYKLLRKKLGFRYLMDITPLDATMVKGSHGRLPEKLEDGPVWISDAGLIGDTKVIEPVEVMGLMLKALGLT